MTVRTTLLALALAVAACGRGDQRGAPSGQVLASATTARGPDHLVLRIPRIGGEARVYGYPKLDTVMWSTEEVPAPARVLAFDEEAGTVAYVNTKGAPSRIDFRQGTASVLSKAKLTGLASADGSTIYGIAADGSVERTGPSGLWKWNGPLRARAVFPQADATLLVLAEHGDSSVVWRLRPPSTRIADLVSLTKVDRTLRTQVGDRLYLGSGRELTGVRTRTMQRTKSIRFDDAIESLEATPSGDRVFVVTSGSNMVDVVDRYRETISGRIDIGRHAGDLRVDPLGRYLLARPVGTDSVVVIAVATNRVLGTLATLWRDDLPFVAPDGSIAVVQGADVSLVDGETLRLTARVRGGASDFWYAFRWTGFRPRDASLDRPVSFGSPATDSAVRNDSTAAHADSASATIAPLAKDTVVRRPGFTVSFAALLVPEKARELASQIRVGNETARVVTAMRDGAAIYRVVLGPYPTREEAERVGRDSKQSFWVYEGGP